MAKKKAECSNLNIGDVVLLFHNAESKQALQGKKKSGFVIADLSGVLSQQLLIVQPTEHDNSNLPTIQYGTFRVLAANKYEAQTRYRSLEDKLNEAKRKKGSDSIIKLLQLQVTQAKRDGEVEKVENAARQARLKGSSVRYSDTVQLQHTLTGRYITVSTTQTSVTESSKLKVSLQRKDSIGCIFRLHPHIKVQTVGEEVNFADQIKFESVAAESQYLHCSTTTFGDLNINVYSECFELNVAANDTPLEILQHYQPISAVGGGSRDNTLKSNGIIRFFHRKHHCYLVGEGSYAGGVMNDSQGEDEDSSSGLRKTSRSICSTLPHPRRLSKMVSEEDVFSDYTLGADRRKSSIFSAISSIVELEDKGQPSHVGVIVEDVHFRKKRASHNLALQPSDSPITFWQIVKCDNQNSGEAMKWSETCRIMHLPSRQYLAVEGQAPFFNVTLRSSKMPKLASMFELFPAVHQVIGEIDCDSYIRIKHKKTQTWLHLNKDVKYQRTSSMTRGDSLEEARELFKVSATTDINSDDAFAIEKVEPELIADYNYVSSITTVLSKQLKQCILIGGEHHSPHVCNLAPALSSLKHLNYLMKKSSNRKSAKIKQKIIRSLKTLEIVVQILNFHQNENGYDQEVSTVCFDVIINFLAGNSNKNKLYLSSMIDQIFTPGIWETELLGGKTVESALIGIAKDNLSLLYEKEFVQHVIQHLVEKLAITSKDNKRAVELLHGLSVFCTHQGVPIKRNQKLILSLFQEACKSQFSVLYSLRADTSCENGTGHESDTSDVMTNEHVTLEVEENFKGELQFMSSQRFPKKTPEHVVVEEWNDISKSSREDCKFVVSQLQLLGVLCQGNNEDAIKVLQGREGVQEIGVKLPFKTIMAALNDKNVVKCDPEIRSRLLELLMVMFVNPGGNRQYLEKFPLSFKLKTIETIPFESLLNQEDSEHTALTGIKNIHVPVIKSWINKFFKKKSNYSFAASEDENNEVVVIVLQLVAMLLKFGYYYKAKDIEHILPVLFTLLNGKDDFPSKEVKDVTERNIVQQLTNWTRRRSTRNNSRYGTRFGHHDPREQEEEDLFMTELDQETANKLLREFRHKGGRYVYQTTCHFHFKVKQWILVVLNLFFNLQLFKSLHHFVHDYRWLAKNDSGPRPSGIELDEVSLKKPKNLRTDLIYLVSNFPWDSSQGRRGRNKARSVASIAGYRLKCIVEKRGNPDLSNSNQLPALLLDLMQYQSDDLVQYALLLLDRHFTSRTGIFDKAKKLQLLLTEDSMSVYSKIESLMVDLGAYLQPGDNMVTRSSHSSPIEVLTNFCWLEDEAVGYEPHQINQKIILSFGILSDVLNYIIRECSNLLVGSNNSRKIVECLSLVRGLAFRNEEVKNRLLQHLDLFLKVSHEDLGPHIGILLREMFTGSPAVCLSLKEDQIKKMMVLVFARGKESAIDTNMAMIDALLCLLMNNDLNLPLSYCQKLVSRNFSLIREDDQFWCNSLLKEDCRKLRMNLLKSKKSSNPDLISLLMITDLLATSAFGDTSGSVSVCCTIFTEEELIEILSCPEISIYRKRPFFKFFIWVYANIQGSQKDHQYKSYSSNSLLWGFVSSLAGIMEELSSNLKDIPMTTYKEIKELLNDSSWKYLHKGQNDDDEPEEIQVEINISVAVAAPSVKEVHASADSLAFLREGILPFVSIFFKELGQRSLLKDEQNVTAANIYTAMKKLSPFLNGEKVYFSDEVQVKLFYRSLLVMQEFKLEGEASLHFSSDTFDQKLLTAARKLYNHRYSSETEENSKFRLFVRNYQAAVEGRNIQRHQLLATRKKKAVSKTHAYSEFTDEEMLRPGVKYLPLGRSFQEFVSVFKKKESDILGELSLGSNIGDTLGNTIDLASRHLVSRTNDIIGAFVESDEENYVAKDPKEGLIRQLEISLKRSKKGLQQDGFDFETQTELDIKCLQTLRAIIYNESIQIDEKLKNKNPEKFRKHCKLYLHPVQTEIHNLGDQVSTYLSLLSHPNERIVNEVLAFLDVLLENSDESVQEGFNQSTRLPDQNVFPTLKSMLNRVSVLHNERYELITMTKSRNSSDRRMIMQSEEDVLKPKDDQVQEKSRVEGDTIVISRRRRGVFFSKWLRRTTTTRVVLVGGRKRVPFLTIYQVPQSSSSLSQEELDLQQLCDVSRVTLVSKVLALVCDGQFREMQNFLREQAESLQSINMVAELTSFLHQIYETRSFSSDTLELFSQILQALVEMCTGNFRNCEVVFEANILSILNYVFQIDITEVKGDRQSANEFTATVLTNATELQIMAERGLTTTANSSNKADYVELRNRALKLKGKAVELLKVMLEKITSKTESLAHQISGGLDIHALQWSMVDFFVLKDDSGITQQQMSDFASRSLFMTYNIFMDLLDNNTTPLKTLEPSEKEPHKAWEYCESQSRKIEISYKDEESGEEVLTNVHFNLKIESEISERVKESLKYEVDRTTYGDKMRDFQKWMVAVKKDTLYRDWLTKKHLNIISWFSSKRYWLLLFLTLVMNIIVIVSYRAPTPNTSIPTIPDFVYDIVPLLIYIIGGVHTFFAGWMALEYFILTGPHFVLPEFLYNINIIPAKFSHYRLTAWMTRIRLLPRFNRTYSSVNIFGPTTIFVFAFLASSILSLFFGGYFYSICLLYVIINNDILQRVLRSVTKNGKSLLWMAILLLIILFIYSVLSFALFQPSFQAAANFQCQTLDQCFVSVIRNGLLGNFLAVGTATFSQVRGRFFFDITFFIIVITIGLNVVFGIILDSYNELRNQRYQAENDMKSTCFVCNLPSHHFEKRMHDGFKTHVKQDHSMWAYIYYSIYLDMIDTSNHHAIEQYVYKKISEGRTDYLPYNKALVLEGIEDDGEQLKKDIQKIVDDQYYKLSHRFDVLQEKYDSQPSASGRSGFKM